MAVKAAGALERIEDLLGEEAESLLTHTCEGGPRDLLHLPGPDHIDAVFGVSDRNPQVLVSLQRIFDSGRLAGNGYLSILPVDQEIEHSGAASFAPDPIYFDPGNIVKLAIEGGRTRRHRSDRIQPPGHPALPSLLPSLHNPPAAATANASERAVN